MSVFRAHIRLPPGQGNQAGALGPPTSTSPCARQQQAAAGPSGAKGKKVTGEKRKRLVEDFVLKSPRPADPNGFMAASKVAARAKEGRQCRQREITIPLEQPSQEGDYVPNPDVMATIK